MSAEVAQAKKNLAINYRLQKELEKDNLYRVREENPTLTKTQLSAVAQVTRPTVYTWLKEVDGLLSGLNKS